MHEKRATLARLVPPVAVMLAESSIVGKYQYPDLEYFSCSAAPLKVGHLFFFSFLFLVWDVVWSGANHSLAGRCVQVTPAVSCSQPVPK